MNLNSGCSEDKPQISSYHTNSAFQKISATFFLYSDMGLRQDEPIPIILQMLLSMHAISVQNRVLSK